MNRVPAAALALGLAGLIPFVWGALTALSAGLAEWGRAWIGPRFVGPYLTVFYGALILAFMSGVIWGFATRATGALAAAGYALAVCPALWALFVTGGGPRRAALLLIPGFLGLLAVDWLFWRRALAPDWWMALRLPLTAGVVLSLGATALA